VGWGAEALTTCNRDSVYVHKVTSLNGSGYGTLDSILENEIHPDTLDVVVFATGGWAQLRVFTETTGKLDCVYIAGQTAPGGGYGIKNALNQTKILNMKSRDNNFVFRGLTVANWPRAAGAGGSIAPVGIRDAEQGMFDQITMLWADEKHLVFSPAGNNDTVRNITVSRSLFAQAQIKEPTSTQISGCPVETCSSEDSWFIGQISYGRNLFHSNAYRNPNMEHRDTTMSMSTELVGNAFYNVAQQAAIQMSSGNIDVQDAYLKGGPATNDGSNDYSWVVTVMVNDNRFTPTDTSLKLFVERVRGMHNQDMAYPIDSLWEGSNNEVACYYRNCNDPAGGGDPRDSTDDYGGTIKRDTRYGDQPTFPLVRMRPDSVWTEIIGTASDSGQVGDYRRIKCDGTWEFRADSMLSALLEEARDSTGISVATQIDSAFVAARWEYTKAAGVACADPDNDGMASEFENLYAGLDPNDASDKNGDLDGDGWSNVEEFVNGTNPTIPTGSDGTEDPGSPPGGASTYGDDRRAHLVALITDTVVTRDTLGIIQDTFIRKGVDRDAVPAGTPFRAIFHPSGNDSSIVLTYDTLVGAVTDSAAVDSILADWNVSTPPYPWAVDVPGQP
jgi:hypothetical protein